LAEEIYMSMLAPLYQIYLNSSYYKSSLTASTQDFTTQHIIILSSLYKQNKSILYFFILPSINYPHPHYQSTSK